MIQISAIILRLRLFKISSDTAACINYLKKTVFFWWTLWVLFDILLSDAEKKCEVFFIFENEPALINIK